jgi:SAM-dependent methyltransferase
LLTVDPAKPAGAKATLTGDEDTAVGAQYGWEDWTWDKSLFEGAAPYYLRGRIPYAEGLADSIAKVLGLDGRGRLLDVGCGPGIIVLRLAHLFEGVVGLDPDAGMLQEAQRAAQEQRAENASWVHLRAEDLPAGLGTFRVITFAQSFHWMDRPKVAAASWAMIEPNGAVVQIDPGRDGIAGDPAAGPHPAVPFRAVDSLRRRYLGPDRRAGQGLRNSSPSGEDAIFQAAGFLPELQVRVVDARILDRTTDDLVAWVFSASSTAPHLFGDKLEQFEVDLRALLDDASPSGHFSVPLSDTTLRIRRPTANRGSRDTFADP